MKKTTINCTVLMAGAYPFRTGKKIHVRKEGQLYFASSEGKDFGLLKEIEERNTGQDICLPENFDGIVVKNECDRRLLTLQVPVCHIPSLSSL